MNERYESVVRKDIQLSGPGQGTDSIVHFKLLVGVIEMLLDGFRLDVEACRNFLVALPLCDKG